MKEKNLIPSNVTYGSLIDACVKNCQVERAIKIFEEDMKNDGVPLNTFILKTLIKGFVRQKDLKNALKFYKFIFKLDDKNRTNDIPFNYLIDYCIRFNEIDTAWKIFEEMKASVTKPDLITYAIMIKGFC